MIGRRVGRRAGLLVALCGLCLLAGAPLGHARRPAAPPSVQPPAQAGRLVQQGVMALAMRDFATAYRALAAAYRLQPSADTLYQLGITALSSGDRVAAQDLMRRFLADQASSEDAAARAEADKIVDQPRPASGEVLVVGERGSLVFVDDRVVGILPLPLPLLLVSGEHKVTLEVSGRRLEGPVRVLPGRTSELRFNLSSDAVVARVVPAVVWVPSWKGVPGEAQKLLGKTVEQSVAKQKLSVVSKGVALAQAPRVSDCLEQLQCLEQLATMNEAGYTLTTTVEATGDPVRGDWTLKLALIDTPTGDYAAVADKRCDRCTTDQASAALGEATTALLQAGAARPKGTLEVLTDPPGADVLLTDRRLGQTPYVRTAFVGAYDVTLKLSGYALVRQHLEVEDGKKASARLTLTAEGSAPVPPPPPVAVVKPPPPPVLPPPPPPAPERGPRPIWRIATGASLIGVGALLGAYGISGLAVDGNVVDVAGSPMRLYSQAPGGASPNGRSTPLTTDSTRK